MVHSRSRLWVVIPLKIQVVGNGPLKIQVVGDGPLKIQVVGGDCTQYLGCG